MTPDALYCPVCEEAYRSDVERCEPCGGVLLVERLVRAPWHADRAGWRVIVAGVQESDLASASDRLGEERIPHMFVRRREDGAYLPPGAEDRPEIRPLLFGGWDEPWLLVVPRPYFVQASDALSQVERRARLEEEAAARAMAGEEADYRLPWERPGRIGRRRFTIALGLAVIVGFGTGLFLIRRPLWGLLCLGLQAALLVPAVTGAATDPLYTLVYVVGRLLEIAFVLQRRTKASIFS